MGPAEVQEYCRLDDDGAHLMQAVVKQMGLGDEEIIQYQHLAEAL